MFGGARLQRYAMLESSTFHWQLMVIACGGQEEDSLTTSLGQEYRQRLALAVLTWALAVHMNAMHHGSVWLPLIVSSLSSHSQFSIHFGVFPIKKWSFGRKATVM